MTENTPVRFLIHRFLLTMGVIGCFNIYDIKAQSKSSDLSQNHSTLSIPIIGKLMVLNNNTQCQSGSFANIAEKLLPTVVNISTSRTMKPGQKSDDDEDDGDSDSTEGTSNKGHDSTVEKFFHNYMNRKGLPDDGSDHLQALGSGFIIDSSGLIVTNYHVIKEADQILITLQDNRTLKATLKGYDERTDIALLQVNSPTPLAVTHFGNSDLSRIGDWVLAIGNPYGLSGTVTFGIISSRGRDIEQGPYDDFIQTDAPINKGNSGGPLFNIKGEVIGINTAIFSPSGGSIGIAFAIPSNEAKDVIDQLRSKGKVIRGWIGVHIQEITESIASSLNVAPFQGALVVKVEPHSPAEVAELRAGDIIQSLNGQPVAPHTMPRIIAAMHAGDKADFKVLRHGQAVELHAVIQNLPEVADGQTVESQDHAAPVIKVKELDISVSNITDLVRQKYNLDEKQQGIVVIAVHHKAKNLLQRIKPGDVIIGTSLKTITDVKMLQDAIYAMQQENKKHMKQQSSFLLLVQSGSIMHWVAVPLVSGKTK